jgi:TRAP-type C4-dicarboxylate transport system permease small subunit
MSLITKIGLFLWTLFAPEKAKVELENIMKEFVRVIIWSLCIVFLLGVIFIAGTYYLGLAFHQYIDTAFIAYLLSALIALIITLLLGIIVFRFLIRRAIKKVLEKGNHILSAITPNKR